MENKGFGKIVLFVELGALLTGAGCGEKSGQPANAGGGSVQVGASGKDIAQKEQGITAHGKGVTVDGEHFTTRVIQDRTQGLPLCVFAAPEKWRDKSEVTWRYDYVSNPVWASYSIENPANVEAMFGYPAARFCCVRPSLVATRLGENSMGLIYMEPMQPVQALSAYIQRARGSFPQFQFIGSKELPGLVEALNATSYKGSTGLGIKIAYSLSGTAVEEEFYAIPYLVNIPYDGPQGRTWQINWGLDYLHSFRAPKDTLDKRRAVFAAIAKSFRPNPAWQERYNAISAYLSQQFNQQLQAGYDQIAAAGRLSRQISANNDAMIASIDRQLQASRGSGVSSSSGGRSSGDKFDDYVRGVETTDDPYYGTSQHSYNEQYHWTDGYGSYRNSNDASYNPNQNENGSWTLMQPAR